MVPKRRPTIASMLFALLAIVASGRRTARAHPATGTFKTNRCLYVSILSDAFKIRYTIAAGALPAYEMRNRIDTDGNGKLSSEEISKFKKDTSDKLSRCLSVLFEKHSVHLDQTAFELKMGGAITGYLPLRMDIGLTARTQTQGPWRIQDRCTFPSSGQVELLFNPGQSVQIRKLGARKGSVVRQGQVLFRTSKPRVVVDFEVAAGKGQGGAPARAVHPEDRPSSLLLGLVRQKLSIPFLLGATLLAFLLGAYHALSPGHGKTVVAAYLVGNRATVKQAMLLAGTVTVTHTFSIAMLGLCVLIIFGQRVPDSVYPYLNLGSGLAIGAVGVYLLIRGGRYTHPSQDSNHHQHHHHQHEAASLSSLLTLGITGGMVPCPTALVVLLLAVSQGRTLMGLYLVLIFGIGLAAVLAAIGVIAVKARDRLDRLARAKTVTAWLPRISAAVILVVGLAIAARPLWAMLRHR